jgi:IS30 family transposase
MKQKFITEQIGVHPSTVSRELNRNTPHPRNKCGLYGADEAQEKSSNRHQKKPKALKFNDEMKKEVQLLRTYELWSPDLISDTRIETGKYSISHEYMYQCIWRSKHEKNRKNKAYRDLYQFLRHCRRKWKRGNRKDSRGVIPGRVPMEKRSNFVNRRTRLGDYETLLMLGKDNKSVLLVMTDRATLHTRLKKLSETHTKGDRKDMIQALRNSPYAIKTITFDNDTSCCCHREVVKSLGANTYYKWLYTSQDKGTVENRIGVIRRFIPKKSDLNIVTYKEINRVEKLLNNRSVRKL